jgi:hypothetical protein
LPRHRFRSTTALLCLTGVAFAMGACSQVERIVENKNEGGFFSKPMSVFAKPDWSNATDPKAVSLGPKGPVGPEELVNADGSCPPEPASPTATAATPPASADGAAAAPLAAAGEPGMPPVLGGIALGMTECQAVRRAGAPANVAISADEKSERKVVLTYLSGPWPGIYTFAAGRLKVVERAPEPPKPARPAPKKPRPRTSQAR